MAVAVGSWLSAYFILVTNAFMQHPVGHVVSADGTLAIGEWAGLPAQSVGSGAFAHNQAAALVTGAFVVTAVGAFYALRESHRDQARMYLSTGPSPALPRRSWWRSRPGTCRPRSSRAIRSRCSPRWRALRNRTMAEITLIGQPNVKERRIDNPIKIPGMLSFLAYGTFHSDVRGLDAFPPDTWPTNIELLTTPSTSWPVWARCSSR